MGKRESDLVVLWVHNMLGYGDLLESSKQSVKSALNLAILILIIIAIAALH